MPSPTIRRAHTDTLEIGYEEHGRPEAPVTMLLHGFPDDARAWDDVVPALVAAGHRVVVPYLRGFGLTRFLDPRVRTAQQAALGQDALDLMNALSLDRVSVVGQDWGSRAACVLSALHPDRVRSLVTIGGYTIQNIVESGSRWRRTVLHASGRMRQHSTTAINGEAARYRTRRPNGQLRKRLLATTIPTAKRSRAHCRSEATFR